MWQEGANHTTLPLWSFSPWNRSEWWAVTNWKLNRWLKTSLVVQWLRIHLPMQGSRVWSLTREDPMCLGATKPMSHNYWASAPEPGTHNSWVHVLQLQKPEHLEPVLHKEKPPPWEAPTSRLERRPRSPQLEKAHVPQQRPGAIRSK